MCSLPSLVCRIKGAREHLTTYNFHFLLSEFLEVPSMMTCPTTVASLRAAVLTVKVSFHHRISNYPAPVSLLILMLLCICFAGRNLLKKEVQGPTWHLHRPRSLDLRICLYLNVEYRQHCLLIFLWSEMSFYNMLGSKLNAAERLIYERCRSHSYRWWNIFANNCSTGWYVLGATLVVQTNWSRNQGRERSLPLEVMRIGFMKEK